MSASTTTPAAEVQAVRPVAPVKERLLSLDIFRGFTLLGMVLVNSHPGKIYPKLGHAGWHRWGFADLIFPFFVFIVGVAIPYAFANRIARGDSRRKMFGQIVRRCVLLFAVGVFLNAYPKFDLANLRVMNVLQRIAICYFMASMIYLYLSWGTKAMVRLSAAILILYSALLTLVPPPGYGAPVLDPVGNWSNYFDKLLLPGRFQHGEWEGKSLFGSFPALVTMLMGLLAGVHLREARPAYEKLTNLFFYGSVCLAAGTLWSFWFPINQGLWSSSLVLFMGGISLLFLAACYYLVDVKKSTWWTLPFVVVGMNSIAVWVFSQLGMKTLMAIPVTYNGAAVSLWRAAGLFCESYLGPMNGPLAFAILFDLFWLGVMWVLYRRRIFIKL